MKTISIGATEARNKFFELIEMVAYQNYSVIIKRNNKELIKLISEKEPENSFVSLQDIIAKSFGMVTANLWPYQKSKIIKNEKQANISW